MNAKLVALTFVILFAFPGLCLSESTLITTKVDSPPIVDGNWQDSVWDNAKELITHDKVAKLNISIKSVYSNEKIFFLVRFHDPNESRTHKAWKWNKQEEIYEVGPKREDCVVFKWAMDKKTSDLSIHADTPYTADVWFWKANRTDPTGYADDKIQHLSPIKLPKSRKLSSKSGNTMFLQRKGDQGKSAYKSKLYVDYVGDEIPQFEKQNPSKSRADIKAKGVWSNNQWCIEFSRPLKTYQEDDVQFEVSKKYFFGVSRYEIAGRKPDPKLSQPLYGSGDVSDKLFLVFSN